MSAIEKILLRKDTSSVIVAIIVGLTTLQLVASLTGPLTIHLMGADPSLSQAEGFSNQYVAPVLAFVLQVIALELLLRLVIVVRHFAYNKSTAATKKR